MRWLVCLLIAGCQATGPGEETDWGLVFDIKFESSRDGDRFQYSDGAEWTVTDGALAFRGESKYSPPHRSPHPIALLEGVLVDDYRMELEVRQTGREYAHRDLCFFFGFESPARFYYTHLAKAADQNAHNVFLVDNAPRRNLLSPSSQGVDWGTNDWHSVVVERRDSTIRVWWDDEAWPIFTVSDSTLGWGRVGFGSFDDSGELRRFRLWAPQVQAAGESASTYFLW